MLLLLLWSARSAAACDLWDRNCFQNYCRLNNSWRCYSILLTIATYFAALHIFAIISKCKICDGNAYHLKHHGDKFFIVYVPVTINVSFVHQFLATFSLLLLWKQTNILTAVKKGRTYGATWGDLLQEDTFLKFNCIQNLAFVWGQFFAKLLQNLWNCMIFKKCLGYIRMGPDCPFTKNSLKINIEPEVK